MKAYSLFFALLSISVVTFAQTSKTEEGKRPGMVEARQSKAREIMKQNFGPEGLTKENPKKKSSFGFLKLKTEEAKKL